ncbi:hypothetical protein [Ralstonia sp.]|uniref:hypothetical protein n=1 Tax=Ralstonia sp. TaxID=54061 RepID=UPI00257C4B0D|nr:hypothetical protein [Ralstonia sp.]MBA4282232.1 hypothetical protein [Ralstonia sp.]
MSELERLDDTGHRREALGLIVKAGLLTASPMLWSAASAQGPGTAGYSSALLKGYTSNQVKMSAGEFGGRPCITVELADEVQRRMLAGGAGNAPSFAIREGAFTDGVIEVDVAGELTGRGVADSRAFVGVAFHLSSDAQTYEAVYLRMTNGTLNDPPPPPPRNVRAVQYVAHPDFHFDVSRSRSPGRYEKAAPVALGRWHRLRLDIKGRRAQVQVDGARVLIVEDLKYAGRTGRIGLWVDDGTRGHFTNLSVTPAG